MNHLKILVIDDQIGADKENQAVFIKRFDQLSERISVQFHFSTAQIVTSNKIINSTETALSFIAETKDDEATLLLLDLNFDSGDLEESGFPSGTPDDSNFGILLYDIIKKDYPLIPIIFVTSKAQIQSNRLDVPYLNKSSVGSESLVSVIIEFQLLGSSIIKSIINVPDNHIFHSHSVTYAYSMAYQYSSANNNILITGESGTGKELLAHFYGESVGHSGNFIAIDIGTTPAELVESEWFGIEKGTATGVEKRTGKFELANNGVLFLDEIADIDLSLQAKLLRVLQSREFYRVGGRETVKVNFRLVCATSKDLNVLVEQGLFREDLYYRIADVVIEIPPLRHRPEDIDALAHYFIKSMSDELSIESVDISSDAIRFLSNLPLRGNVRELRGIINRLMTGISSFSVITEQKLTSILNQDNNKSLSINIDDHNSNKDLSYLNLLDSAVITGNLQDNIEKLKGAAKRLDLAYTQAGEKLVCQALIASRHPVTNKYNKRRAAQILSGDEQIAGQEPLRLLNRLLGRKVTQPLSNEDCSSLIIKYNSKAS